MFGWYMYVMWRMIDGERGRGVYGCAASVMCHDYESQKKEGRLASLGFWGIRILIKISVNMHILLQASTRHDFGNSPA